jgi:hypothetical protein
MRKQLLTRPCHTWVRSARPARHGFYATTRIAALQAPVGLRDAAEHLLVTLFVVLAVILAVLLSLVPLLNAEEQAQQHHELVNELVTIREEVDEIRQAVARSGQLVVDTIGHYVDASSSQRLASESSSVKISRTSILCFTASATVIGIVVGRYCGRPARRGG